MAGYVGLSDAEAERLCELISTVESDYENSDENSLFGDPSDDNSSNEADDEPGPSRKKARVMQLSESDDEEDAETPVGAAVGKRPVDNAVKNTNRKATGRNKGANNNSKKRKKDVPDFRWTLGNFNPTSRKFDDAGSGFHSDGMTAENILDYFQFFFTPDLAQDIVAETNRYFNFVTKNVNKKQYSSLNKWHATDVDELYLFISVTMLISRNNKLKMSNCWSKDPLLHTPMFNKIMSRDRYLLLLRLLHFCDNDKQPKDNRLYKLEVVFSKLKESFLEKLTPFQNVCIDESLVLFKGRLSFKQYIKTKRHRFGVKLFVLADGETNYILDIIIYTGSTTQYDSIRELGISGSIVATMMKPYLGKGYCLYTDNWYTSPLLADYLLKHKTYLCGTVKSNRLRMPTFPPLAEVGQTSSQQNGDMMVTKWLDRRVVHMLTTIHKDVIVDTGKKHHATGTPVKKPLCVKEYNANMGSIDKIDMLLSSVECLRKTMKWYKEIFFHLVDLVVINSHAMYKVKTGEHISLADFQLELIRELIVKYVKGRNTRIGRRTTKDTPLRLGARHFPQLIPSVPGGKKNSQKICHVCKHTEQSAKRKRDSRYYCKECDVGLCVVPCFERYLPHFKKILISKKQLLIHFSNK